MTYILTERVNIVRINHDNQYHMIAFAFASAAVLSFFGAFGTFIQRFIYFNIFGSTYYYRSGLYYIFVSIISQARNYLIGAGIFMIVRAHSIRAKGLPYTAALIAGICAIEIPSLISTVFNMIEYI